MPSKTVSNSWFCTDLKFRVCTGSGKPGKSWNLLWHFPGLSGNLLNSTKNMKRVEGSKENYHWDLGSLGVNVSFRALGKSIWNLFLKKGTNPVEFNEHFVLTNIFCYVSTGHVKCLKLKPKHVKFQQKIKKSVLQLFEMNLLCINLVFTENDSYTCMWTDKLSVCPSLLHSDNTAK